MLAFLAAAPGVIWTIIKNFPAIWGVVSTLIGIFTKWESALEAAAKIKQFHTGVIDAHKEGDTSGLEKLFNGGNPPAIPAGTQQLPDQPANP